MLIEVKKLTRHMIASGVNRDAASLTSLHVLKFTIEMDLRDSLPNAKSRPQTDFDYFCPWLHLRGSFAKT